MQIPDALSYSKDHEWIREDADGLVVGITDYAQDALGDIVFVGLPDVGTVVTAGEVVCEVESTKSVSEVYAPVSGQIVSTNEALNSAPELLNGSPYDNGWMFKITPSDAAELSTLLNANDYRGLTEA